MEFNRVVHGDCAAVLACFPAAVIDLVVTSPPYDNLRDYGGHRFDFARTARELARVLKPGGVIVWNVADQTIDGSESCSSFRQALYFRGRGLRLHDTMIYQRASVAYPAGEKSVRYSQEFEYVFVFSKGSPKAVNLIADKKNAWAGQMNWGGSSQNRNNDGKEHRRRPNKDYGVRGNIWRVKNSGGFGQADRAAYEHPATMPEELARDHIHSWSNKGDLVLDPFLGSGTTAVAAVKQGREWIGIEANADYCELARRRIADTTPPLL